MGEKVIVVYVYLISCSFYFAKYNYCDHFLSHCCFKTSVGRLSDEN